MSSKRIRYLLKIMEENDLAEIELEEPEFKIKLRKKEATGPALVSAPAMAPAAPDPQSSQPNQGEPVPAEPKGDYLEIKSPMVGTFYRSSSPENDSFVKEGDEINDESVVCIIEAMKVMNEIKSGVSGKIVEIMVENAQPVEYGQVLFRVSAG